MGFEDLLDEVDMSGWNPEDFGSGMPGVTDGSIWNQDPGNGGFFTDPQDGTMGPPPEPPVDYQVPPPIDANLPTPQVTTPMTDPNTILQSPAYLQWAKTVGPAVAAQAAKAIQSGNSSIIRQITDAVGITQPGAGSGGAGGNGNGGGGGGGIDLTSPLALNAFAMAANHYADADRYTTTAEKYAGQLNPFGDQRDHYKEQLRSFEDNPAEFMKNDPEYQFMRKQGLDSIGAKDASTGRMAYDMNGNPSGEQGKDYIDYATGLATKYTSQKEASLANLAGAQFGPAAAGAMLQTGLQGSIESRNNAINDIFYGLNQGNGSAQNGGNNNGVPPAPYDPSNPNGFIGEEPQIPAPPVQSSPGQSDQDLANQQVQTPLPNYISPGQEDQNLANMDIQFPQGATANATPTSLKRKAVYGSY